MTVVRDKRTGLARDEVRTVIGDVVAVVVGASGDVERRAALDSDDRSEGPVVHDRTSEPVAEAIMWLPDDGGCNYVALVEVGTLPIEEVEVVVLGLGSGAVAGVARGIEVEALQSLGPDVEALCAEALAEALLNGDLQSIVVGTLRRLNLRDSREGRVRGRCCGAGAVRLRVIGTAIGRSAVRVGVGAGLRCVRAGRSRGTAGSQIELGVVDVPLRRQFTGESPDVAGREGKSAAQLLLE